MSPPSIISGVDNLMRKAKGVPNKPFGGCVVVFSGDFRQCLPIVVGRAPLSEIVKRCIPSAEFEPEIDFHHDFEDLCSIYFVRQFPLCLCFAVTINKSQGQTFSGRVGLYLKKDPLCSWAYIRCAF